MENMTTAQTPNCGSVRENLETMFLLVRERNRTRTPGDGRCFTESSHAYVEIPYDGNVFRIDVTQTDWDVK